MRYDRDNNNGNVVESLEMNGGNDKLGVIKNGRCEKCNALIGNPNETLLLYDILYHFYDCKNNGVM